MICIEAKAGIVLAPPDVGFVIRDSIGRNLAWMANRSMKS